MKTYQHYIDGQYVDPVGQRWFDTVNPYTGEAWARIPQGCARDVDRAVQAASRALREGPWPSMTATARGKLMLRLADLVTQNAERLAEIEVRDNGKLIAEMRGQMNYHPEWWRYFGGLADKIEGRVKYGITLILRPVATPHYGGHIDARSASSWGASIWRAGS